MLFEARRNMMDGAPFRVFEGGKIPSRLENEREILLSAQTGDSEAFRELYEHYKDRIYNLIYYSLKDAAQAEDALQSVFVKVLQALPFFRLESCFLTWLYRVALNECKNRQRRKRLFVPMAKANVEVVQADHKNAPDVLQASEQSSRMVRRAVMELKPKYRTVVILKYLEDLSYEEIAAVLGHSSGTVASRLYRALEMLEKKLSASNGRRVSR